LKMNWDLTFIRRLNWLTERGLNWFAPAELVEARPIGRPIRRVLLVKFIGLGDGVLVRSLAEHLRRRRPDMHIGILTGPATREVLSCASDFTCHYYDPGGADAGLLRALKEIREIRRERYEVLVDFEQHWMLVSIFLALTGIPFRIGLAAPGSMRARFQTHTVLLSGEDSMWKAYVRLARLVDPSIAEKVTTIPLPRSARVVSEIDGWCRRHLKEGEGPIVAMHLGCGSSSEARRWPIPRFVDLAERIRRREKRTVVFLTGTRAERPLVREFSGSFSGRSVDATSLGPIERSAELLRRCDLLVSNDTGVMHLGAAMGTPTVGLFGPNTPARYGPVGPYATSVYATGIPCSPCIHIHLGVVPECFNEERGRCMLDIDVESVFQAAQKVRSGKCLSRVSEGDEGPGKRDTAPIAADRSGHDCPATVEVPDHLAQLGPSGLLPPNP